MLFPVFLWVLQSLQWFRTTKHFQQLRTHRSSWRVFTHSVEWTNSHNFLPWNNARSKQQCRCLETVYLSIHTPKIQSNFCPNGMKTLTSLAQFWSSAIIWRTIQVCLGIIALLCSIWQGVLMKRKKEDGLGSRAGNWFLNSVFHSNIDDRQSIGSAVLMEFTVMIVACKRSQEGIPPKRLHSIYQAKKQAMVLAAVFSSWKGIRGRFWLS